MAEHTLSDTETAALEAILAKLHGPGADLPPTLFRFVTEVAATPNIDLAVHDPARGLLLAWRHDAFGQGWHVPGSIIRHREEIGHRLQACAADEFGCELDIAPGPVALVQIFDDRGHSVSLCFPARLRGEPTRPVIGPSDEPRAGDLCWFKAVPTALYPSHHAYRPVLQALQAGHLPPPIPIHTQHVGERDAAQESPEGAIDGAAELGKLGA